MKQKILLFILTAMLSVGNALAQTLNLVPHPPTGTMLENSKPIILGSESYFRYKTSPGIYHLARYNGATISLVPNLNSSDPGYGGVAIIFNNEIYINYKKANGNTHLARYNWSTNDLTIIDNPNTTDPGFYPVPMYVLGSRLYFIYKNGIGITQLARYDGISSSVAVVANANATDQGPTGIMAARNSLLYLQYQNSNIKYQLALCGPNDSSLSVVSNLSTTHLGVTSSMTLYNNDLYFEYMTIGNVRHLAKYNASNNSIFLIDNFNTSDWGFASSSSFSNPVVFNGELYLIYRNSNAKYQLAKYSGTGNTLTYIPNISNTDYGVAGDLIVYANNLYLTYSTGTKRYLGRYDGSSASITLLNNPNSADSGPNGGNVIYNNEIFCRYSYNNGVDVIAKYNGIGNDLVVVPILPTPNSSYTSISSVLKVTSNGIYFKVQSDDTLLQVYAFYLGRYKNNSISVFNNPESGEGVQDHDFIFENDAKVLCRYTNLSEETQLAFVNTCLNGSTLNIDICQGNSYFFNGQTLTADGIYYDTLTNVANCDSIVTLELQVNLISTSINQSICTGNSYFFNGQLLTTSGVYVDTFTTSLGCDSLVYLNLQVSPLQMNLNVSLCGNAPYYFNGQFLNTPGTYADTLVTSLGCDSIVTLYLTGPSPKTNWAVGLNTSGIQNYGTFSGNQKVTTDVTGNVYAVGNFAGTLDFDPGIGVVNLTSAGNHDVFVCKYNAAGALLWAKAMGGSGAETGQNIATDASGNVYTTGSFIGTADFNPNAGVFNLITSGSIENAFITKLDGNGDFVWAKQLGGNSIQVGHGIDVDASGNVYTTGYFAGTSDFDPGAGVVNLTGSSQENIYISKLNASGNYVWAKIIGSTGIDKGNDLDVDGSGNVYVTGAFVGTVDFDPNGGIANLTATGMCVFVCKLSTNGDYVWAKTILNNSFSTGGFGITLDANSNVYSTGFFNGTNDFDPGAGVFNLNGGGAYLSKLDVNGDFVWARNWGSTGSITTSDIVADLAGDIYTVGRFSGTADFDPGPNTTSVISNGSNDIFISKLNSNGQYVWAKSIGGLSSDVGYGVAVNSSGNLYVTGSFSNTVDFNPTGNAINIASGGVFIMQLNSNLPSPTIINQTICSGSNYSFNGQNLSTTGTYYSSGTGYNCDSVFILNLTVIPLVSASIDSSQATRCALNGTISLTNIGAYTSLSNNNFSSAIAAPFSTTGSATINNGEMQLTAATNSLNGAFIYTPTSTPSGFTALFDMNIFSSQASGNNVADGISFNYGVLQSTPIGHEDGLLNGNGLVIRFKEWQTQRVEVVYNGVIKGTYDIDLHNPKIRKVRIAVLPNGKLDLSIGDQVLCTNLDLGVAYSTDNKTSWKFAWGSRTGGSNNRHAIDNIEIYSNENGIAFTHDNWTSQRALPFFNVVPNSYTILGGNATCSSTIGTATITDFNASNVTTVSNTNNPTCTGRTITVTNTLVHDTLVWSDFASRPTLSNFNDLGNATFSNGSVQLTDNTGSQNGRIIFPQTPNAGVFTATFKARVWDGNNADGFSFNYGQIDNVSGAEAGMMNTNTPGLSVGFPTWNTNNIVVKYKNIVLTTVPNTGSGGNRASFFTPVEISVNEQYQLTVKWNGTTYINNYNLVANSTYETDAKTAWQFGWAARTGGQFDRHQLDDILIVGKPGLLYSYDGGTTFETNATKTISNTNAVSVVVKADGICSGNTVSFPAITTTTPTFTQVAPICAGASIAALPTTSLNGIVGTWSPSINNVASTTYIFTPSSSCNPSTTMTIVVNPLPSILSVSATPSMICASDSSKLIVLALSNSAMVTTFAGSGIQGSANGIGSAAAFNYPYGVATDAAGNLYVADRLNHKIRKITPAGVVSTFAGSGSAGSADGTGVSASFNEPTALATDTAGNIYVVDLYNMKIRKITPAGVVSTLAGSGVVGNADGTGTSASFNFPSGVGTDLAGNVYVGDAYNHKIRKITPAGVVTTFAGSGSAGSTDGTGTSAQFNTPTGVATDAAGNVYVVDRYNHKIRKITPAGVVSTFAGSGSIGSANGTGASASFYYPFGIATDLADNVYVADLVNNKIRKITPAGVVTTLAGSGNGGSTDGNGISASFNSPTSVATDAAGNVYVADQLNHKIRKITPIPPTYSWSGTVNGLSASLDTVSAMPATTTIYTVTASTAAGCTTTSTVTVTVKPNYTINASAGTNGNITSLGNTAVCEGSNKTYTITPNANYQIADVLVDGISVGAVTSYTFNNVTAPHTISASFVLVCVPTSNTTNATACYTYTWGVNNVTYNASGTYTAITGCHTDSLILTIEACKDVKCLIQGHYVNGGPQMPVLLNSGISAPSNYCDTLVVSLHSDTSPYLQVYTFKGILGTNGIISCSFPESAIGNNYYIVLTYRNALQTWSKNPVAITNTSVYDFSTNATQAFGDNQVQVSPTEWAMYSGDINHDGSIDSFDYLLLDGDLTLGASGYLDTDLIGDGAVDTFDYLLLDPNLQLGLTSAAP